MNAFLIIIELVEVTALVVLLIYLIRLIRDHNVNSSEMSRSTIIDSNMSEVAGFHRLMVNNAEIARIWQDGIAERRLNDLDEERFSYLAEEYLTLLANQRQRADTIEDKSLADAATLKLVETLQLYPGLLTVWEVISSDIASPELREAVAKGIAPVESDTVAGIETPGEAQPAAEPPATTAAEPTSAVGESAAAAEAVSEEETAVAPGSNHPAAEATPAVADNQSAAATDGATGKQPGDSEPVPEQAADAPAVADTADSADRKDAPTEPAADAEVDTDESKKQALSESQETGNQTEAARPA